MGRSKVRRGIAALGLVLGMTAGMPMAVHAGGSGCTSGQWTVMSTPSLPNGGSTLYGAFSLSATDVWAAGTTTSGELFEHWDGTAWSVVPGAGVPDATISAISGTSDSNVWAFGSTRPESLVASAPLVERWNGRAWHLVVTPAPPGGALTGGVVLGPADVWAYGYIQGQFTEVGFVEHWNGRSWSVTPNVGYGYGQMAATSDSDVWIAAGIETAHWDGKSWTTSFPAIVNNNGPGLYGIAVTPTAGPWASGYVTEGSSNYTDVQTWDGTGWTQTTIGAASPPGQMESMSAASSTDVWSVGVAEPSGGNLGTAAAHWDGTAWTSIPPLDPGGIIDVLYGVSALPGQAWAVGDTWTGSSTGLQPLIETYCG